jgi:Ribonuclease D
MINSKVMFLESDIPSEECKQILENETELAIDTETTGLDPLVDDLRLIQIYSINRNIIYFFRFNQDIKFKNLITILSEPKIKKYFHNAVFDMRFIERNLNVIVKNPICTKIGAKLKYDDKNQYTLKYLVKKYKNIELDKSMQTSNWGQAELSNEQIKYALSDVLYLKEIWSHLSNELEQQNKLQYALNCFDFLPTQVFLMNHVSRNIFDY